LIPLRDSIRLERLPLVTIALIAANVVAYLIAISAGGSILDGPTLATVVHYGAIPYEFTHLSSHCDLAAAGFSQAVLCSGQAHVSGSPLAQPATWETAFTGMFMHANLLHIGGNMIFLAVFGCTLEDSIGRLRFLAFYLLGGLAALALTIAVSPDATTPTLGASGAIAAVLGGYILLFPRARVLTVVVLIVFFTVAELPAWVMLGLWLVFDALLGSFGVSTPFGGGAGVAYYAHIGGFAFGLLAVRAFAAGRAPSSGYGPPRTA
jgi:membrane associated rhomboid family serine protease